MLHNWKRLVTKHVINSRGFKTNRMFIVFESDDWGSIRIPSIEVQKKLISKNVISDKDQFSKYDTLENESDLNSLFNLLSKYTDLKGNPPIFTANCVVANPDFKKIKDSNFQNYYFEDIKTTFKNNKGHENCFQLWKEGMNLNFFHPQFHGREHINIDLWLEELQKDKEIYKIAFENNTFAVNPTGIYNQSHNIMAALDYRSLKERENKIEIIKEGYNLFKDLFGYDSKSYIAPCYVWDELMESEFKNLGIEYFQGSKFQYIPNYSNQKFDRKFHYTGQENKNNQHYLVRNCLFEPSLNQNVDWVEACMESIRIAFLWKRPAIIGTHRINFASKLSVTNRDNTLIMLDKLLSRIIKTWPEVEFITSDQLGEIIKQN